LVRRALRYGIVFLGAAAAVWLAAHVGRAAALVTLGAVLLSLGGVLVWMPRAAHRAFRRGDVARAEFLYRVLRFTIFDPDARASVFISLAACALARERHELALEVLRRVQVSDLSEAARAAWFNNQAYALARSEADPSQALESAERALMLRPQVAGFRHTRGIALIGLGRLDEAIRELDAVWTEKDQGADEPPPLFEAERCYDLGVAWRRKGEAEYARDYFERAQRAAPNSVWAQRAVKALGDAAPSVAGLGDLI
jgi:tetratricopeptide (TPR) repeat protein